MISEDEKLIGKLASQAINFQASVKALGLTGAIAAHAANLGGKLVRFQSNRIKSVSVRGIKHSIYYRIGTSDWPVLRKVMIEREYDIPSSVHTMAVSDYYDRLLAASKQPIIVDCGANIGLASVRYADRYPHATIYAIELEPNNFSILLKNCRKYSNIVPVQAAVSDRETFVSLMNASDEPWAWETKESTQGDVQTVTIPELASRNAHGALFIVKVDIEGFEVQLFRSNVEWVAETAVVVFESHDGLFPWRGTAHAMLTALSKQRREYLQRGENTFSISHSLIRA